MVEHITSKRVYYTIFAALLALTFLTVVVARIDLGRFNTIVALTIAVTKAVLVVLFFMHVYHSSRLTKLTVVAVHDWSADAVHLTSHHALLEAGVVIVEGLDLSEVEPGEYDMTCLPLRIVGAEGAPARVILRSRL